VDQTRVTAAASQIERHLAHAIDDGLAAAGTEGEELTRKVAEELRGARELNEAGKHAEAGERLVEASICFSQAIRLRSLWWRVRRQGALEAAYLAAAVGIVLGLAVGWARPLSVSLGLENGHGFWGVPASAFGFGALGSLLRSPYWLARQVDRGVYRSNFALGHFCAPSIGGLFGAFIYLLLQAGLFVLNSGGNIKNAALPAAVAFLAGFNWETVLDWVE